MGDASGVGGSVGACVGRGWRVRPSRFASVAAAHSAWRCPVATSPRRSRRTWPPRSAATPPARPVPARVTSSRQVRASCGSGRTDKRPASCRACMCRVTDEGAISSRVARSRGRSGPSVATRTSIDTRGKSMLRAIPRCASATRACMTSTNLSTRVILSTNKKIYLSAASSLVAHARAPTSPGHRMASGGTLS